MSKNPDLAALFGATDATTFLGLSACTEYKTMSASSAFIGAPGSTPYGSVGSYCRNAPEALRVIPILIGGDDSVPIPMLDAMADTGKKYTILQIDAHIDWRESHMDESLGLSSTMRRASEMAHINRIHCL